MSEKTIKKDWREDMKYHVLLAMPDGSMLGLWIPKDVDAKEYTDKFYDNWYRVTTKNPDLYNHIILEEKCPKCGEELRGRIVDGYRRIWCINHLDCDYKTVEEEESASEMFMRKLRELGMKAEYVDKTGYGSVAHNAPRKKK